MKDKFYVVKLSEAFDIEKDDVENYVPTEVISTISFIISPENSHKLELYASVSSDFLLLDASMYLTESKSLKTIVSVHKKNLNVLSSGALEAGTYVLTIRYYKRIRYSSDRNQLIQE